MVGSERLHYGHLLHGLGAKAALLVLLAIAGIGFAAGQMPARLLTDDELRTKADPQAAKESEEVAAWVRAHSHPLRSLVAADYSDLQFLKPLLRDKSIVQLGESSHGVAEFNLAKIRLVKFLHQEMGFDVIAFESPLYECYRADARAAQETPVLSLRDCLLPVWHTSEVLELFKYLQQTKSTARPLILSGIDIQQRGWGEHGRPEFLRDAGLALDQAYAAEVFALDRDFLEESAKGGEGFNAYLKSEAPRLIAGYEKLMRFIDEHSTELKSRLGADYRQARIARQTAFSLAEMIRHRASANRELSDIRDAGMAVNLDFLRREIYPGKRVIVWAHNAHVRHRNEVIDSSSIRRMGSWLVKEHRRELYTIGLYMYRGRVASNSRRVYEVARARGGSLESILYQARKKFLFLDLSRQKRSAATAWIFEPRLTLDWGRDEERLTLRDQYDAIVFIDTVNPPNYRLR